MKFLINPNRFNQFSDIILKPLIYLSIIIFSVNLTSTTEKLMSAQISILLGIMFFFLAITPWICAICIKLALQNK